MAPQQSLYKILTVSLQDAYILAHLITRSGGRRNLIPKIAKIYNDIRCPTGNQVLEQSLKCGLRCELDVRGFEDIKEGDTDVPLEKLVELFNEVEKDWRWAAESAEHDKEQALAMLGRPPLVLSKLYVCLSL